MSRPDIPLLDADLIKENLDTSLIGRKIIVFKSTASTNMTARLYAKDKTNDGLVIFTEEQTEGRGRFSNKWHSRDKESILCSILLLSNNLAGEILSMACSIAVSETIGNTAGGIVQIKWPNDILLNGKKVAGILIENEKSQTANISIIGIGVNCHQKPESFPEDLRPTATSIEMETHSTIDRNIIARRLLHFLDVELAQAQTNPQKLAIKWQNNSIQLGHRTTILFNGKKFTGTCIGIDPEKGIILQLERGGIRFFDAAHSSIAKK